MLQFMIDGNGVLVSTCISNIMQPGFVAVSADVYNNPIAIIGRATYANGVLTAIAPAAPEVAMIQISKAEIWRRSTDAEAVAMIDLLNQQTPRMQRIFNDASYITTTDDLYPNLLTGLTQLFGADRAAALLAPTGT